MANNITTGMRLPRRIPTIQYVDDFQGFVDWAAQHRPQATCSPSTDPVGILVEDPDTDSIIVEPGMVVQSGPDLQYDRQQGTLQIVPDLTGYTDYPAEWLAEWP